ncbi:hypothetical protein SAMN05421738_1124 [Algoriella xinjiangensis]|uniref:Uncharacterized protein n=1 Tax=Algoriella xinjiangensis TaxID=684065 RepID=A0A1I4YVK5_9FLAO|nr:hypothetical protein SAMN05421738_1124 [Algoriella xinjiangensis]
MHNEEIEFEILDDKIIGYDSYYYIEKSIKDIEIGLIFHWDILAGILILVSNNLEQYKFYEYFKIYNYYIKSKTFIIQLILDPVISMCL